MSIGCSAHAWGALERARIESVSLRDDIDHVRKLADSYRPRLSGADTDFCASIKRRIASYPELLEEGAELFQRVSAKHDALAKIHNEQEKNT
jgi:hypothetical protein